MIDDVTTQLRRGVVEYCVLGLLASEPMYGWQLASALTERGLIASIGTLYPLLGRLRDRGLIVAFEQSQQTQQSGAAASSEAGVGPPSGGPTRKYYRLTPPGEDHLERFRAQWGPFTESVTEIIERGRSRVPAVIFRPERAAPRPRPFTPGLSPKPHSILKVQALRPRSMHTK